MCKDTRGNKFIIEMQLGRESGFQKRALYYAAKTYCGQRTSKVKYKDLKDVYFLAITGFKPFPRKKNWISHIALQDVDTNEIAISDIQLFFLQLPLFKKTKKDIPTMTIKEKWAFFLKYAEETTEEEVAALIAKDEIIKRAYDELNRFNWSEEELQDYESVEMKQAADRAINETHEEIGKKEGRNERSIEIVKNLLKMGLSEEDISKATDLSPKKLSNNGEPFAKIWIRWFFLLNTAKKK